MLNVEIYYYEQQRHFGPLTFKIMVNKINTAVMKKEQLYLKKKPCLTRNTFLIFVTIFGENT